MFAQEGAMSGLGGLNKSPAGVVIGMVQLQLPTVTTPEELAAQTARIVDVVGKARRNLPAMHLVVFPEYSLHGLSMSTDPALMCRMDGPEVAAFSAACRAHHIWGCFSIMEANPRGNPYNTGIIFDDQGELRLYYRKLHPWVPVEPWEPGDVGIPVCDGPNGSRIGLIICHDGMFPEMARECAYKGAEIILRTAGYTAPIRHTWRISNQANAFSNLAVTASVCLCGTDGTFDSMGEGMIVNFDGVPLVTGSGRPDEIITAEVRPDLVREAGASRTTFTSWVTAATSPSPAARAIARTRSCTTSSAAATACRGRIRCKSSTGRRAASPRRRGGTRPCRSTP
jgi:formamidase